MRSRNLPLLFFLGNQVDGEFPIAGVNGAYYTGEFVYTNLETTAPRLFTRARTTGRLVCERHVRHVFSFIEWLKMPSSSF